MITNIFLSITLTKMETKWDIRENSNENVFSTRHTKGNFHSVVMTRENGMMMRKYTFYYSRNDTKLVQFLVFPEFLLTALMGK